MLVHLPPADTVSTVYIRDRKTVVRPDSIKLNARTGLTAAKFLYPSAKRVPKFENDGHFQGLQPQGFPPCAALPRPPEELFRGALHSGALQTIFSLARLFNFSSKIVQSYRSWNQGHAGGFGVLRRGMFGPLFSCWCLHSSSPSTHQMNAKQRELSYLQCAKKQPVTSHKRVIQTQLNYTFF